MGFYSDRPTSVDMMDMGYSRRRGRSDDQEYEDWKYEREMNIDRNDPNVLTSVDTPEDQKRRKDMAEFNKLYNEALALFRKNEAPAIRDRVVIDINKRARKHDITDDKQSMFMLLNQIVMYYSSNGIRPRNGIARLDGGKTVDLNKYDIPHVTDEYPEFEIRKDGSLSYEKF